MSILAISWPSRRGVDRDKDCRLSSLESTLTSVLEVRNGLRSGAELPEALDGTGRPSRELNTVFDCSGLSAEPGDRLGCPLEEA